MRLVRQEKHLAVPAAGRGRDRAQLPQPAGRPGVVLNRSREGGGERRGQPQEEEEEGCGTLLQTHGAGVELASNVVGLEPHDLKEPQAKGIAPQTRNGSGSTAGNGSASDTSARSSSAWAAAVASPAVARARSASRRAARQSTLDAGSMPAASVCEPVRCADGPCALRTKETTRVQWTWLAISLLPRLRWWGVRRRGRRCEANGVEGDGVGG